VQGTVLATVGRSRNDQLLDVTALDLGLRDGDVARDPLG
jgi:hypothetical protein